MNTRTSLLCVRLATALPLAACDATQRPETALTQPPEAAQLPSTLWQLAPVVALENGVYEGAATVGELRRYGDHGLGTVARANGELVVAGGRFYRVDSLGAASVAPDTQRVTFAILTWWPRGSTPVVERRLDAGLNFVAPRMPPPPPDSTTFQRAVDSLFATHNWFYTLRLHGTFSAVKTRSFAEPKQPYPPFCSLVATQDTFNLSSVTGTMVGFVEPAFVGTMGTANLGAVSIPGYHLHFITDDGEQGGHVLSFTTAAGVRLQVAELENFQMRMPRTRDYTAANLTQVDTCP